VLPIRSELGAAYTGDDVGAAIYITPVAISTRRRGSARRRKFSALHEQQEE